MTCDGKGTSHPPIKVFYYHYHNSIRSELDVLSRSVLTLETSNSDHVIECLTDLKVRVAFLERVYSIHSSVEDEVQPFLFRDLELIPLEIRACTLPDSFKFQKVHDPDRSIACLVREALYRGFWPKLLFFNILLCCTGRVSCSGFKGQKCDSCIHC